MRSTGSEMSKKPGWLVMTAVQIHEIFYNFLGITLQQVPRELLLTKFGKFTKKQ